MKTSSIQLLVRSNDATFADNAITLSYPGVKVIRAIPMENTRYLSIDLEILPEAKPGTMQIEFKKNKKVQRVPWMLKPRRHSQTFAQGVTSSDVIYLLMPDRFSNGDPSNDLIKGMRDQKLNRDSIFYRHGGDLPGATVISSPTS